MAEQTRYVDPSVTAEYVEQLAEAHNLSDDLKDSLFAQIRELKRFYGDQIPEQEFIRAVGAELKIIQTGYKKTPVSVEEFVYSPEYLNLANSIRPKIVELLTDLYENHDNCFEVCLSGSLGWGKTYTACVGIAYDLYRLSCLYNPQTHFNLSPGSEFVFTIQSVNEKKAARDFRELKSMVESSRYFQNHFPNQSKSKNYLVLPHNIVVKPVSSNNTAVMSENVFGAVLDEANFLQAVKGSATQGMGEGYYDQATMLYNTVKSRIETRFKEISSGTIPGKLFLVSSSNYKGDFMDLKYQESKTRDDIYVYHKALWEVRQPEQHSGEKFWVKLPDEKQAGKILDEKPEPMTEDYIEVPIEYKQDFRDDLHSAIRNIAGVPIERTSKFIPSDAILQGVETYNKYYDSQQIFTCQEININEVFDLSSLLNLRFIEAIKHFGTFHAHLDMALTNDSAGLSLGFVPGSKTVVARDESHEEIQSESPIYALPGMIRINPPEKAEIDIEAVQKLLLLLKHYLPNFTSFRADRAFSASFLQTMRKNGINSDLLSVDKNSDPYFEAKNSFTEGRVWVPEHHTFKEELKYVYLDASKGKIEHEAGRSKDVADSAVGVIFRLSKMKKTWKTTGIPYTLKEMREVADQEAKKEQKESNRRPSVGKRPRSGNRKA